MTERLAGVDDGLYVVGTYLGTKGESTWTPPGETAAVKVPAKLGVEADGREVAVVIDGPEDLGAIAPGIKRGELIVVPVRVFAQRNGRGVRYVWAGRRGLGDDGGGGWS